MYMHTTLSGLGLGLRLGFWLKGRAMVRIGIRISTTGAELIYSSFAQRSWCRHIID